MKVRKIKLAIIVSIVLLLSLLLAFIPLNQKSISSHAESNENFTIDVYGRNGNKLLSNNTTNYNNGTGYIFDWKDAQKFVFNIDTSSNPPTYREDANGQRYYTASISVEYLRGYHDKGNWNSGQTITLTNIDKFTTTVYGVDSHLNLSKFKPELDIDKGVSGTFVGANHTANEWGIYRFTLVINNQTTISDYFIIQPTIEIYSYPQTKVKVKNSNTSFGRDAYHFSLENEAEFRYIDKSKLVWYARGKTIAGKTYALSESDLNSPEFSDCNYSLNYDNNNRTGLNFIFEDDGNYGTWEIWCVYQADGYDPMESEKTTIETKVHFSYVNVIIICVCAAVALVALTIGICIYKNKREKVY